MKKKFFLLIIVRLVMGAGSDGSDVPGLGNSICRGQQ